MRVKDNNFIVKTGEADSLVEAGPVQRIIIRISLVDVYFMLSCMNMDSAKFSVGREWDCSALDNTKVFSVAPEGHTVQSCRYSVHKGPSVQINGEQGYAGSMFMQDNKRINSRKGRICTIQARKLEEKIRWTLISRRTFPLLQK